MSFFIDTTGDPSLAQRAEDSDASMDLSSGESTTQSPGPPPPSKQPQHDAHPQHDAKHDARSRLPPAVQAQPPINPLSPKYAPWQYNSVAEIKARRAVIQRELKMLSVREKELKAEKAMEEAEKRKSKKARREERKFGRREETEEETRERYERWEREYREWDEVYGEAAVKEGDEGDVEMKED